VPGERYSYYVVVVVVVLIERRENTGTGTVERMRLVSKIGRSTTWKSLLPYEPTDDEMT
jgi:hypothetical protein